MATLIEAASKASSEVQEDVPLIVYIDNKAYDLSEWQYDHPGGVRVLEKYRDKDATDIFYAYHSSQAVARMRCMKSTPEARNAQGQLLHPLTGAVLPEVSKEKLAVIEDWRKVAAEAISKGLLTPNPLYSAALFLVNFSFLIIALWLLVKGWWFTAAFCMGLFYHLFGLLGHDFSHRSVTGRDNYWTAISLAYFCSFLTGYGTFWWKERHNNHHCSTNILQVDPDVTNLPIFCWDVKEVPDIIKYPGAPAFVCNQHIHFWFLQFIWNIHWLVDSIFVARSLENNKSRYLRKFYKMELGTLIAYHIWSTVLPLLIAPSIGAAIGFIILSHLWTGFHTTITVATNHYASEFVVKDDRMELGFLDMHINGTLNYEANYFNTWYSGTSNYQVEHHLFPTLPHGSLIEARRILHAFVKKHKLEGYQEVSFLETLRMLHRRLVTVAYAARQFMAEQKAK